MSNHWKGQGPKYFINTFIPSHAIFLISFLILCPSWTPSLAQEKSEGKSSEVELDTFQKVIMENHFNVSRGMSVYKNMLGSKFNRHLELLEDGDRVLDSGAGECDFIYWAVSDSFAHGISNKLDFTGITFQISDFSKKILNTFSGARRTHIISGRYFEDITNAEILGSGAPFSLIVDLFGVFSYSQRPDLVLKRYVEMLQDNGAIFIYASGPFKRDAESFTRYTTEKDPAYLGRKVTTVEGEELDLMDWLAREESGLAIVIKKDKSMDAKLNDNNTLPYVITKRKSKDVVVHPLPTHLEVVKVVEKMGEVKVVPPIVDFKEVRAKLPNTKKRRRK